MKRRLFKEKRHFRSRKAAPQRQALADQRPAEKMGARHDAIIKETGELLRLHGRPRRQLKQRTSRRNRHLERDALRKLRD